MTDLGVVDPMRPPASVVALTRRIRSLPPYAIGFLLVFVVRAIADLYASAGQFSEFGPSSLLGLLLGSVPDWLTILIPVAVALPTLRLDHASPLVVRGAIAVGLSEVVTMAARAIGGPENPSWFASATVRMLAALLLGGGLIWMARGLESLRVNDPSARLRSAALVAVAIGITAATLEFVGQVIQVATLATYDLVEDIDRQLLLANTMGLAHVLVLLAWVYLAWVLIRGNGDAEWAASATRMGAASGWFATAWLGANVVALAAIPFASETPDGLAGPSVAVGIVWVSSVVAATCTLMALAALAWGLSRGLAAQSGRGTEPDLETLPADAAPNR